MNRLTAAAVAVWLMGAASAAAGERPFVSEVSPYVRDGRLVCDVRCGGLFSERIVGTIQSGLPAVMRVIYSLETRDGKTVANGMHALELSCDVWEEVYAVSAGDSTETFAGAEAFERMSAAVEHLHGVAIAPASDMDASRAYRLSISISIHPLTGTEERRVEGFVDESVGARSHESWREQLLSVNELISRFFSRDKGASNRSEVFRSASFAPGELPGSRLPVDGGRGGWTSEMTVALAFEVR